MSEDLDGSREFFSQGNEESSLVSLFRWFGHLLLARMVCRRCGGLRGNEVLQRGKVAANGSSVNNSYRSKGRDGLVWGDCSFKI